MTAYSIPSPDDLGNLIRRARTALADHTSSASTLRSELEGLLAHLQHWDHKLDGLLVSLEAVRAASDIAEAESAVAALVTAHAPAPPSGSPPASSQRP